MSYSAQAHFGQYNPAAFGWAARDPFTDPSLLVPFHHSGAHFGSMHRDAVGVFTALLNELVPLIPNGIAGDDDEGCYNPDSITVGGSRSFHTYAIAIDINWKRNPMFAPRPTGPWAVPPQASQIARKWGCEWGGDWSYPQDWMHLELHLTPEVARTITPGAPTPKPVARQEDDDMPVVTITTHPTNGRKRAWATGPKGMEELVSTKENPQTPEAQARALARLWGVTPVETSEVDAAIALPASTAKGKAF